MTEVATLPLALFDLVPVALAGVGALLLARLVSARAPEAGPAAILGAALVLAGGLCKASWKLVLATTGDDLAGLADLLFVLLAPGFVLLAWALLAARNRLLPRALPLAALALSAAAALLAGSLWPLLVAAVLAATTVGGLGVALARDVGDASAAVLFGLQLAMAYALVPLAGAEQSIAHQWWEQSLNTVGQGALAVGAWRLVQNTTTRSYA